MYGSERVRHILMLETFAPGAAYKTMAARLVELLDTRSLKDNTRLIVVITPQQWGALHDALGRIGGVRPHGVMFDSDWLRATLATFHAAVQQGRVGFAPDLGMRERLQQELLAVSAHETLEPGLNPGPLATAAIAACQWTGGGAERPLPDDPARDKITPLDLTPAPEPLLFTVRLTSK